jgi:ATP-binding protein involved in chromosome partitioning
MSPSGASSINKEQIRSALMHVLHPVEERDLVSLEMVQDLIIQEKYVSFTLEMPAKNDELARELISRATTAIKKFVDAEAVVDITVGINLSAARRQEETANQSNSGSGGASAKPGASSSSGTTAPSGAVGSESTDAFQPLAGVTHIIAVASGKGGVGKSTVASNLAVALAASGARVGLMDTDIYGPSVPTMFDVHEKPSITTQRKLVPIEKYGVKLVSMGFLVDPDQAMIWRGPMVTSAVKQFMQEVEWGELDYMILDLPPGTGDIQLTIVQSVPLTGAVIVSTPQTVALDDARKGVAMFQKVHVPVLGIIENMAWFSPSDMPEKKYYLFGKHGARRLAERLEVPFLGEIPLIEAIREGGDKGRPVILEDPQSLQAQAFKSASDRVIQSVEAQIASGAAAKPVEITIRP